MFVVPTNFDVPPFNLPKLAGNNSFQPFANQVEKDALQKMIGTTFYLAFIAGLAALPANWVAGSYATNAKVVYGKDIYKSLVDLNNSIPGTDITKWEVQATDRWLRLKLGDNYKVNGADEEWGGMTDLLIPKVFAEWLGSSIKDTVAQTGVVEAKSENGNQVSVGPRYADALTKFARKAGRLKQFETDNLFRYLYTNSEIFDDVVADLTEVESFQQYLRIFFKNPGIVNTFDI